MFNLFVLVCAALTVTFAAAEYPDRPIRLIVPAAPGGGPDVSNRLLAAELGKQMGQQFVIDNRPAGNGTVATDAIAKAPPDGYTMGQGNIMTMAITRSVLPALPYDVDKDLQMVAQVLYTSNLLGMTPLLPIKSVQELIDYAKANPDKLLYGSPGNGSSIHLSGELFKQMTGTQMMHVPYKAAQQAITEIIGGQVHLMFDNMSSILPHVKAGRLRGIAVTSLKRSPAIPELPTVSESGVPGFEVVPWGGMIVPAGVPKAIVARVNKEINKAIASPAFREKMLLVGYELVGGTPEQFTEHVRSENAKWAEVVKRAGIKVD